jgi:hypothetical protein
VVADRDGLLVERAFTTGFWSEAGFSAALSRQATVANETTTVTSAIVLFISLPRDKTLDRDAT